MIRNIYINIILLDVNGWTNHRKYLITHNSAAVPFPRRNACKCFSIYFSSYFRSKTFPYSVTLTYINYAYCTLSILQTYIF